MCRAFDIRFVLALGADARYTQKFFQLVQVLFTLCFYGFDKIHSVLRQEFTFSGR